MYPKIFKFVVSSLMLLAGTGSTNPQSAPIDQTSDRMELGQLENFVDNFVAEHMESAHAPGLVITVVSNGGTVFLKGYGLAELEAGTPITPQTPLRAGSVSKVITSAAVLQLVDQGLLDLDAPVSAYIPDLALEDSFGPASTVSQLLTLQGGYPEVLIRTHSPDWTGWLPLGEHLAKYLPERTLRPGTVYSYSSWEHALLGLALENIAGAPFDQVLDAAIFAPLQMAGSTFAQPPSADLLENLAQGYFYRNGQFEPVPYDFVNLTPGIALVTNAEDMGRFMQMLLNDGVIGDTRVLQPGSVEGMLLRQNEVHPFSRARTFGFSEINLGGRAALYQDGNGIGFANRMVVIPEHGFGLFVSTNHRALGTSLNRTPANAFIQSLSAAIVENFLPPSAPEFSAGTAMEGAAERAPRYSGHYRLAGTAQSDFFKIGALLDNVDVRDNGDGSIRIGSTDYIEVEPLVFQRAAEPYNYVIFTEGPGGGIEYVTFGGTGSYAKVKWLESFKVQAGLAVGIALISLATALVWPFTRQSPALLWLACLVQIGFLAGLGWTLTQGDLLVFYKDIPLYMSALLALPWLHLGITALAVIKLAQNPEHFWPALPPILAAAGFIAFTRYWQLFL